MKYASVNISVSHRPQIHHKWLEKSYPKDNFNKSTRRICLIYFSMAAFIDNIKFLLWNLNINNLIIIIIKKDWQYKAGRGRLTPYQSEDPSPTLPPYRGKEEKGKIVEDKKGENN